MLDSNASGKIDEFERALEGFREEIESDTALHTAVVSSRVLQEVEETGQFSICCLAKISHLSLSATTASNDTTRATKPDSLRCLRPSHLPHQYTHRNKAADNGMGLLGH